MKRAWLTLGGAMIAVAIWMVAPALSTTPYRPAAVDFEQPLPTIGARAAGAFVSPVIHAPHRFDAVGVVRARFPISYRVRRSGGRWSPWTEADDGNPVWAGGSDEVQLRSEHGRPRGRLHYVNVSGTAGRGTRLLTALRRAVNTAVISVLPGEARAARARSSQNEPPIVSRSQWGADQGCPPRTTPAYGEVKAAIVHHTVSANDYTAAQAPGIVLAICRFHRNGNGWNDIGYNALVDRYGVIYEGRAGGLDQAVVGAQAQGYNSQTTGIASIGDHSSTPPTDAALNAIARFLSWKLGIHGLPATGTVTLVSQGGKLNRYPAGTQLDVQRISGHRDFDSTACPGDALYGLLDRLRSMVQVPSLPVPVVSLAPQPPVVVYPGTATLAGRLIGSDTGQPLAGAPVTVQYLGRKGWRSYANVVTDNDGSFQVDAAIASSRTFRARAPAYGPYRTGLSPRLFLPVRPGIQAQLSSRSHFVVGGVAIVKGTIRPLKRRLVLSVLRQNKRGLLSRVARIPVQVRRGRFGAAYQFHRAGSYVFRVVFKRDAANASARASDLPVRVRRSVGLGSGGATGP